MDIEKTMEFLLEQHVRHATAIQQLDERMTRAEGMIRQLIDVSMSLARLGEETDRRFNETDRRFRETDRLIRELRESQVHSDRRLEALIDVADKLMRRNGGSA